MNDATFVPSFVILLMIAVPMLLGIFLLVRRLVHRPETRKPVLVAAGGVALLFLGFLAVLVPMKYVRERESAEIAAVRAEHATKLAAPAVAVIDYQHAWTDRYPAAAGAFPEWVTSKALAEPSAESLPVAGLSLSFARTDPQDRLAGYSDFQAGKEEAVAQAWQCLKARIEGRVLARCALLMPREFAPFATPLGLRIREAIGRQLDARRASLPLVAFDDEVDVASLGNVYRAAVCLTTTAPSVDAIASAAIKAATDEEQRLRQEVQRAHAERLRNAKQWAYCIGGALFLLLIITSVYLFLNAHTKGYYAWTLRIVAFVIYAAAVGAFVVFFRKFTGF